MIGQAKGRVEDGWPLRCEYANEDNAVAGSLHKGESVSENTRDVNEL